MDSLEYKRLTGKLYDGDLNEFVQHSPKETMNRAKEFFQKARAHGDHEAMKWWSDVYTHAKSAAGGGAQKAAGAAKKAKGAAAKVKAKAGEKAKAAAATKAGKAATAVGKAGAETGTLVGKAGVKAVVSAAKFVKNLPKNAKKFATDPKYRKEIAKKVVADSKRKGEALKKLAVHEVDEIKGAGAAIAKKAKGGKLTPEDKKALKSAATKVGILIGSTLVMGGAAHGAAAFGKHLAVHFAAENAAKATATSILAHQRCMHSLSLYMTEAEAADKATQAFAKEILDGIVAGFESLAEMDDKEVAKLLQKALPDDYKE